MTPTGVDLKVVRERLDHVARSVSDACALPADTLEAFLADRPNPLAAESALRRGLLCAELTRFSAHGPTR